MNFATEELSTSALTKLFDQKRRNSFCDLTLLVNGRVVKAHRNVLSAASPYFDSVLKHHRVQREQLTVTCGNAEVFERLVDYTYTGRILVEREVVEELLRLADHFLMTKVIEYCIEFLGTQLGHDNCLFTYYLTQRFRLKQLGSLVENWICTHLQQIVDGEEIKALACRELLEFLKNKIFSVPFTKLLKVVSDWTLRDIPGREADVNKLFAALTWTDVDHNEVYEHLEMCELYGKSELALYYLLHHLMINNMLLGNFKGRYDGLHSKYEEMLKNDGKQDQNQKITISEKDGIVVKARNKNRKEQLLARLLAGLKPGLRAAAIKAIRKKNKKIHLVDYLTDNIEVDSDTEEKIGVKCPICSANINDSMLLEQHLALSHSKDVTYKCGICNFVCQYHGDYLNHAKTHFSGPPFKCDFCDFDCDAIAKLVAHRAKHLEDAAFQCTFCSFKCRSKPNYLSHLKLHAPEKLFKCDQCTKSFKYKHNLDAHMATHSSEKTLHCESCGFHTKFLSHMIAHKRIHAGDMYRCSYPHCKYSTSKKQQLVTHAKTHNGLRPHACAVCGRGFMEKSHLVRHERIHLEEKPFKCTSCDYASSRRDKLKEHFTRHHGENASAKVPYKARPLRTNSTNAAGSNGSKNKGHQNHQGQEHAGANNNVAFNNASGTSNAPANGGGGAGGGHPPAAPGNGANGDIQELIMHHHNQNGAASAGLNGYHHFGDATDFHHHSHNIQQHLHNQRNGQHHNNMNHHHMLGRSNHSTATSTAAAVAAAMMLDPRFHHNSTVPYPTTTPVTMAAMAAAQSSQQIQASSQHVGEYPPSLQNCMPLF